MQKTGFIENFAHFFNRFRTKFDYYEYFKIGEDIILTSLFNLVD